MKADRQVVFFFIYGCYLNTVTQYSVKLWWWKSLTNFTSACWIIKIFLTKVLHLVLENFGIAYFTVTILTWVCQGSSRYVGTWNPEVPSSDYPCKKDAPEDKDPPEGKKLPNLSGPYLSKVILFGTTCVFHSIRVQDDFAIPYAYVGRLSSGVASLALMLGHSSFYNTPCLTISTA